MIVPTRPNPWQPTVPNTLIHIKRQQRENRPPKWPSKKQPPKARHGFKFSCHLQSCTKGDSPSFLSRSWWAGRVVGLACAYLIMFRSPMSVQWHQHQWVESQPHHCHTIPVIHTHALCKGSGKSSDLPVSYITMTLSGRTGVNGWKFSDLWTCTYVAYLNTLTTELLLRWTWVSWSATN